MQILASLTTAPAERFGESNKRGRIAKGMDVRSGDSRIRPVRRRDELREGSFDLPSRTPDTKVLA
jgi:hypothetical protein